MNLIKSFKNYSNIFIYLLNREKINSNRLDIIKNWSQSDMSMDTPFEYYFEPWMRE